MSSFVDLLGGFGTVLSPQNLLFAAIGVTLGTLVGVLPGIGPALTIALLLPVTFSSSPIPAFILFAGHLLRRDVRRLDDVDPAQHAGRVGVGGDRDRGLPDGQARAGAAAWRPPRSARSSRGRSASCCWPWPSRWPDLAVTFRADRLLRADGARVGHGDRAGRRSLVRGLIVAAARPHHGPDRDRRALRPVAAHLRQPELSTASTSCCVAVGLFAVGEALYVRGRSAAGQGEVTPLEPPGQASCG